MLQSGQRPSIADWLPRKWSPEASGELFKHLLELDVEYRRSSGSDCSADHYRSRYPTYSELIDEVLAPDSSGGSLGPGATIGPFEILRELGRGGMGIVFEASQAGLDRRVALKVLPTTGLLDESTVLRFQNEAKAVASLHHSNIVPLLEAGEADGVRYYAMQLIEGRPLDRVIRELRETPGARLDSLVAAEAGSEPSRAAPHRAHAAIARIGLQIADALATAHRHGILHRDIKPSNVILEDTGRVWVTDFGLARLAESDLTRSHDFLGTLRYMSPERFDGEGDERADIYALGATLYELAALQPAFPGVDHAVVLDRIRKEEPPPLGRLVPDLPRDLQTIIEKCLCKEPARRYGNAGELANDLQQFLESRPIRARRATRLERLVFWSRRNPAAALLLLVMIVAVIGSGIAALVFRDQSRENRELARSESKLRGDVQTAYAEVQASLTSMEEARNDLRQNLYFASMSLAMSALDAGSGVRRVRQILDEWRPSDGLTDLRRFEWYLLESMAKSSEIQVDVGYRVIDMAWSPFGLIAGTHSGAILWDPETGTEEYRFPETRLGPISVTTDGRWLAAAGDRCLFVFDLASRALVATIENGHRKMGPCSLSPDGSLLAILGLPASDDQEPFELWSVTTGQRLEHRPWGEAYQVSFSPDSSLLALTTTTGFVELRRTTDLELVRSWKTAYRPTRVSFSPDGRVIAFNHRDEESLRIYEVESGKELLNVRAHRDWGLFNTISSDGRFVASGGRDYSLFVFDRETEQTRRLFGPRHFVGGASFAPLGHSEPHRLLAASYDGLIHSWDLDEPLAVLKRFYERSDGDWFWLQFHPDGDRLATIHVGGARVLSVDSVANVPVEKTMLGWFDDGRYRLYSDARGLRIVDDRTGADQLFEVPDCDGLQFDGNFTEAAGVFAVGRLGGIWTGSASEAPRELLASRDLGNRPNLALSADATRLVVQESDEVRLLDVTTGESLSSTPYSGYRIERLAFHPSGEAIAIACTDQEIRIWDLLDGSEPEIWSGHAHFVESVAFNPDGTRLASGSRDGTVKLWDWQTGTEILSLHHDGAMVDLVAWSPDGQRLASVDKKGHVRIFSAAEAYAAER